MICVRCEDLHKCYFPSKKGTFPLLKLFHFTVDDMLITQQGVSGEKRCCPEGHSCGADGHSCVPTGETVSATITHGPQGAVCNITPPFHWNQGGQNEEQLPKECEKTAVLKFCLLKLAC